MPLTCRLDNKRRNEGIIWLVTNAEWKYYPKTYHQHVEILLYFRIFKRLMILPRNIRCAKIVYVIEEKGRGREEEEEKRGRGRGKREGGGNKCVIHYKSRNFNSTHILGILLLKTW